MVSTALAIDGWPIELYDTAGLHAGGEELEREGMERARQATADADLCLWVIDGSASPVWPGAEAPATLLVINKIDLPPAWDYGEVNGAVRVSSLTGAGLPELCDAISRCLVPDPPAAGAPVPFTAELCERVERALRTSREGQSAEALRIITRSVAEAI